MHIAILTPIAVEYNAIRKHLENIKEDRNAKGLYEKGFFKTKLGNLSIVLQQTGARNSSIALATERIIELYNPKIIFLVGVAGGVKDVAIGDIVVAKKAYAYESGKETVGGFKSRPEVYSFTSTLQDVALSVSRKEVWERRTGRGKNNYKCLIGAIASGDKVIATQKTALYTFLKTTYNDTLAVDMEASGFGEVFQRHLHIKFLCIRGISDLLDDKSKSDDSGSQVLASENVAAFTFELISQLNSDDLGDNTSSKSAKPAFPSNRQVVNNNGTIGTQINIQNHTGDINVKQ
jgi:nucleoside phosphorylase